MTRRFVWTFVLLMLCACLQQVFAMGELTRITKQTQGKAGLNYTLIAERVKQEAVLVRMEIASKGKLKDLRSVNLTVGAGSPLVGASLETTRGKQGSWLVTFQLSPDLADQCFVDLIVPTGVRSYVVYAVELKGYVTDRK